MYAEDLVQTKAGSMVVASVSVSSIEPCLVDSEDHVLMLSWTPLAPTILQHSAESLSST